MTSGEPVTAARRRSVLIEQEPLVGVDRSVEPHGVVDRRDLQILPLVTMRTGGRGDHAQVGQIRQRASLHQGSSGMGSVTRTHAIRSYFPPSRCSGPSAASVLISMSARSGKS